jgi:hypothetical protein
VPLPAIVPLFAPAEKLRQGPVHLRWDHSI